MAHHSSDFFPESSEAMKFLKKQLGVNEGSKPDEFVKSMSAEQADSISEKLKADKARVGATGNFPDGKLTDNDEGEIKVAITQVDGRVVINFGKPIVWIGFTKEQAIQIAESLIKHSK